MHRTRQKEGRFRVVLIHIGDSKEEEKESFCKNISENYGISFPLLRKIVDRCPIVLKKDLSLDKAETLAETLRSFGATASVEEREDFAAIFLEFQQIVPHRMALESSYLRRTSSEAWNVIGRARNISEESLNDTWVLIQLFDHLGEILTFEEAPLPINPLLPGQTSPFKVIFDGELPIERVSIIFKSASGYPIPAEDRRRERECVEMEVKVENKTSPHLTDPGGASEEIFMEEYSGLQREGQPSSALEDFFVAVTRSGELEGENGEETLGETHLSGPQEVPLLTMSETTEMGEDFTVTALEENENLRGGKAEVPLDDELSQTAPSPILEEGGEEGKTILPESGQSQSNDVGVFQETLLNASECEVATQPKQDSERTETKDEEFLHLFPWIEDFRNSVENYYRSNRSMFSVWFETQQKEGEFANPVHSLLTILAHTRFDQMCQPEKALENTQRVFKQILRPNLLLEEIPPLEGTKFFSGENWRDLFYRALPKLQQVANNISKKEKWNGLDLMRLIQVIPHMGDKNSRMAVRWINELIPHLVEIDFSNAPIFIGESLYRVASRLGVVDPHFDHYQGRNSTGDLKIQSFAKKAFPQFPMKIEEPMTWMGMKEEEGGHCFPTQPRCEGCLFETFCPRLHFHFNPSGMGMRAR